MTARQQIRAVRMGRERSPIDAQPAPSVGETLQAARERKGVDLYRAERDTKIRARHLAALESGDYTELPGSVYTKGFLRNYALYLALDPEDMLSRWRDEQDFGRRGEPVAVTPPPQPLMEPRRGFTFSPGILIAAVLSVVVLAFAGYIGLQLVRFTQVPAITVDGDRVVRLPAGASTVVLRGASGPSFLVNVAGADGAIIQTVTADDAGTWTAELGVSKGRNDFTLVARDPETGRESGSLSVIVSVPLGTETPPPTTPAQGASPLAGATSPPAVGPGHAASPEAASPPVATTERLDLEAPVDGASIENQVLEVRGTTDAQTVVVSARWAGEGPGPAAPEPQTIKVRDGRFAGSLQLPAGGWTVDVATPSGGTSRTSGVEVRYRGVFLTLEARDGAAWVRVWVDGEIAEPGRTVRRGDRATFAARRAVIVSTGSASTTYVVVNGVPHGLLGKGRQVATVEFAKGKEPRALD